MQCMTYVNRSALTFVKPGGGFTLIYIDINFLIFAVLRFPFLPVLYSQGSLLIVEGFCVVPPRTTA